MTPPPPLPPPPPPPRPPPPSTPFSSPAPPATLPCGCPPCARQRPTWAPGGPARPKRRGGVGSGRGAAGQFGRKLGRERVADRHEIGEEGHGHSSRRRSVRTFASVA